MRFIGTGLLLSLAALVASILGLWRPALVRSLSVRLHALDMVRGNGGRVIAILTMVNVPSVTWIPRVHHLQSAKLNGVGITLLTTSA